jgi:hypothetical protein
MLEGSADWALESPTGMTPLAFPVDPDVAFLNLERSRTADAGLAIALLGKPRLPSQYPTRRLAARTETAEIIDHILRKTHATRRIEESLLLCQR